MDIAQVTRPACPGWMGALAGPPRRMDPKQWLSTGSAEISSHAKGLISNEGYHYQIAGFFRKTLI